MEFLCLDRRDIVERADDEPDAPGRVAHRPRSADSPVFLSRAARADQRLRGLAVRECLPCRQLLYRKRRAVLVQQLEVLQDVGNSDSVECGAGFGPEQPGRRIVGIEDGSNWALCTMMPVSACFQNGLELAESCVQVGLDAAPVLLVGTLARDIAIGFEDAQRQAIRGCATVPGGSRR